MSDDISHLPEFQNAATREAAEQKRKSLAREVACTYARVFTSADGKAVLEDLRAKFGHSRPRFDVRHDRHNALTAALIDGQCYVLREIENAIEAGGGKI